MARLIAIAATATARRSRASPASCAAASSSAELPIEVDRGADQRQVGERLREVPEQLAARADLLGVEAEVVRVGEHLLEREPRFPHAAGARERLYVPEAADRERAFVTVEPVG